MEEKLAIIKRMEDRIVEIMDELNLMEEAYKVFPEPSEQLDNWNKLNDEFWYLYQELEAIEKDSE